MYKIYWKDGDISLACVYIGPAKELWLATTIWIQPRKVDDIWDDIQTTETIQLDQPAFHDEPDPIMSAQNYLIEKTLMAYEKALETTTATECLELLKELKVTEC